jgi:AcrR family transcriptional regulator
MSNTDKMTPPGAQAPRRSRAGNHKARVREASIARILDAAEQLFAEFGYHGVTLKDVAARVGVSSTLIHYHFKGKESIFEAVWARRAPLSARNRLESMRRYAQEVGDNVTVEGALLTSTPRSKTRSNGWHSARLPRKPTVPRAGGRRR